MLIFVIFIFFIRKACQCYGHSNNCTYDAEIDKQNLSIDIHGNYQGGGVCIDCLVWLNISKNDSNLKNNFIISFQSTIRKV